MRVLVGVDGSNNSFAAVDFIARITTPERDHLTLLFAAPALSIDEKRLDPGTELRARNALSRTVLEAAADRLPERWKSKVELREVAGSASSGILSVVDTEGADLVAVGFRGTSNILERFMLGSVSRAVVHSASVPVLVVRSGSPTDQPVNQSPGPLDEQMHVLVASDRSPVAERIASVMEQITFPENARGWLLTVIAPMFVSELPEWVKKKRDPDIEAMAAAWEAEHQQGIDKARKELALFRARLPACFAEQDALVIEGRPGEEILKQIRNNAIDLVVVGSRGEGPVRRLLLGSTSEHVLRESECSVLIVR